jgi:hypothetical protein
MLKVVASAVAAVAVAISAAGAVAQPVPQPTATPFAIGTFQPLGNPDAPFASSLPNIGRTRAVNRACAAMRDLIVPSFEAALRADKRFAETRKSLPNYADIAGDPIHRDDGFQQMLLSKLDRDASALLQESLVLNKALGDPRIAANVDDPQVIAERRALQQLYEAQQTRANLLNEFVIREHVATAKQGIDDGGAFRSRASTNYSGGVSPPPAPNPSLTAPPGMPLRSNNPQADRNSLQDWGTVLNTYVRTNENQAAKTFFIVARTCK